MIEFDEEFAKLHRGGVHRAGPGRAAQRGPGRGRRELPLRRQGERRPGDAGRRTRSSRRGSCPWSKSTARPSPRRGSGPRWRPATWRARGAAWALRSWSRARWSKATSGAASSASRPPTSSPTTASSIPGHGVYAAFANGVPAAVNVGVRPTFESGRGVLIETYLIDHDEDLYGQDAAGRLRRAPARRARVPRGRRTDRADAPRRRGRPAYLRRPSPRRPRAAAEGRFAILLRVATREGRAFYEMSLTKEKKSELIGKYGRGDGDTGSAEVQVALLTERINELTDHLRDARERSPLASWSADAGR